MAHPVLSVDSRENIQKKAQVHLLPCRIHHDGNVNPVETYWSPSENEDNTKTAYLRGRKLQGKAVKLPEGYYGSVAEKSAPKKPERSQEEMVEDLEIIEDPNDQLEVGAMQGKATFDEFVVWNHETLANSSEDPYLRGMEEWISFAGQIHSYPSVKDSRK
ncbi:ribonuclease H1 small subunit [Daldinia caldariorum]|uniref:ribonuclease H1 small subunit n=1 Tax=Daldinia caldariorum TaxID=326644 RepID=UPI00200832E3|nr:ribonuclease H1 small subunit [Daldinia caldariorum]KAI1463047.1 ribonuclease H1 small subunit [Daldinia caldariorum]